MKRIGLGLVIVLTVVYITLALKGFCFVMEKPVMYYRLAKAKVFFDEKNSAKALPMFEKFIKHYPSSFPVAYYGLAHLYAQQGQPQKAVEAANKGVLQFNSGPAYLFRAQIHMETGDLAAALKDINTVDNLVSFDEKSLDSALFYLYSSLSCSFGEYDKSIAILEKDINASIQEDRPQDLAGAYFGIAALNLFKGDTAAALQNLVFAENEKNAPGRDYIRNLKLQMSIYNMRATIAFNKKDYKNALQEAEDAVFVIEELLELKPDTELINEAEPSFCSGKTNLFDSIPQAYKTRGDIKKALGDTKSAAQDYKKFEELSARAKAQAAK